jgi:hypothetical protein
MQSDREVSGKPIEVGFSPIGESEGQRGIYGVRFTKYDLRSFEAWGSPLLGSQRGSEGFYDLRSAIYEVRF